VKMCEVIKLPVWVVSRVGQQRCVRGV